MNLTKLIGSFNLKKFSKASRTDFGVLKVAFMVAALDGEVTDAEYKALEALAKKCRGYTPKAAATAFDEAMRSAGYLMLLGRRTKDAELVKAFVREAQAALPNGFAYFSIEDVRRAVVTWIALGMSDGDYSVREKKCVEALRKHFAKLAISRVEAEEERWRTLSPAFRQAVGSAPRRASVDLVAQSFVTRVERLVALYGDEAGAASELKALVEGRES